MPTVDFTYSFDSDSQGFIDRAGSNTVFSWQSADSQTGSGGCVKTTTTVKSTSMVQTSSNNTAEGGISPTWVGWGVPAGSMVTGIQLISWYHRVAANVKLTSWRHDFYLFTSKEGNILVFLQLGLPTTVGGWTAGNSGNTVSLIPDESENSFFMYWTDDIVTSGGGGNADVDVRVDEVTFRVTYEMPSSGASSDPLGMSGFFGI